MQLHHTARPDIRHNAGYLTRCPIFLPSKACIAQFDYRLFGIDGSYMLLTHTRGFDVKINQED